MIPIVHNHPFKIVWNFLMLAAILLFLFIITFQIIFKTFVAGPVYYSLNALFFLDIAVNFSTKVKIGHIRYETAQEIRKNYLRTWFFVDLIAAVPFELVIAGAFGGIPDDPHAFMLFLSFQSLTLVKIFKVGRIFRELQESLSILPAVSRLILFGYWVSAIVHLMVLGWVLIGATEAHRSAFDQYLRGLYWVITTIATIGYGDYTPDHDSNMQIMYSIAIEIFGVGMFSYVIANVSSLIANLDVSRSAWQRRLEEMNAYMRSQGLPPSLQERVRDYYSYLWSTKRSAGEGDVLHGMPGGLAQEIRMFLNREMLTRVTLFRDADELFLQEAVRLMKPQVFLPNECIIRQGEFADCMYFLTEGSVRIEVGGSPVATIGPGSPFGETALVTNQFRNASVVSETYGTGYRLDKGDFNELRAKYPEFDRQVEEIANRRMKG